MSRIKSQELLVLNPLFYSDMRKYIWISDSREEHRYAQLLFDYLLKRNIYITGFVSDKKSLCGLRMYNKKIFDISMLDAETSAVFYDPYFRSLDFVKQTPKLYKARVVNPDIRGKVIIWGAGITGESACKILQENKIEVEFFVDSNKKLEGTTKCGLLVQMPDELYKSVEEVIVIEALEKWKEVDDNINGKIKKRFHYSLDKQEWNQFTCIDNGIEKYIFELRLHCWSFNFFMDRRVYIYGYGAAEREFIKYLKLMDYDFAGFLVDEADYKNDEMHSEYSVKYVDEIIYESNYFIWIYDIGKVKKLKELGLVCLENYINIIYPWDISIERRNVLDVNLGYNYLVDSKYPGIMVYGDEEKGNYKIAVLGGSTTDGVMYPFKSWPELLHEKLGRENITIYNCGIKGYTSGQELIKLIRDVLLLKPDMIITYDGFNELGFSDDHYPFAFDYIRKVFNFANSHLEDTSSFVGDNKPKVCLGVESRKDAFGNWLSNIQIMHAIAIEKGIRFYSFFQPMLSSKQGKSEKEMNMLLSMPTSQIDRMIKMSFREHMSRMQERPDYMYDLSHIFDEQSDIYMDVCHVWEKGNEIIAEEIKKIILPEVCNLVIE